jgi:hypothetical protein
VVCLSGAWRFLAADSRTAIEPAVKRLPPPAAPGPAPEASAAEDVAASADEPEAGPDDALRWATLLAQLDAEPAAVEEAQEVDPTTEGGPPAEGADSAAPAPIPAQEPRTPAAPRPAGPAAYW